MLIHLFPVSIILHIAHNYTLKNYENYGEKMTENLMKTLTPEKIDAFRRALVGWYKKNRRDLPWRMNQDPYRIWVSEIMLQQTRVDTVIPYFERFMTKFPTMTDFAYAEEAEILKAWEGLGYYSRVRNLQIGMRTVIEEFGGEMPRDLKDVLSLKGVGPYTAGAILSIVYGLPEPAVDGNVMRVISRIFEIPDDIMKSKTRKIFEELLYQLIDPDDPSSFNQGLMEIGALVCTPTKPMCLLCPLQEFCSAHINGKETDYPVKIKKIKTKKIDRIAMIVEKEGQVLVEKRPEEGLLANLWQFPTIEVSLSDHPELIRLAIQKEYGLDLEWQETPFVHVRHIFSHLVWEMDAYTAKVVAENHTEQVKWMNESEMAQYAFPVPYQKVWQAFLKQKGEI